MTHYLVITPPYDILIPILDDGTGPVESHCDVLEIEAINPREAKINAVREWRRMQHNGHWRDARWIRDQQSNNANPFSGLKVEDLDELGQDAGVVER